MAKYRNKTSEPLFVAHLQRVVEPDEVVEDTTPDLVWPESIWDELPTSKKKGDA